MIADLIDIASDMGRKLVRTEMELDEVILDDRRVRVQTVNLHHLYLALKSDSFRRVLLAADAVTADGWPVQLLFPRARPHRVTGSSFVERLVTIAPSLRVAIVGATSGVGERVVQRVRGTGVSIVYREHGDRRSWLVSDLARDIARARADLVIVAVSPPGGEEIAAALKVGLPSSSVIAVGGALDMLVGAQVRGPRWARAIGLEWASRMLANPRRLAKRYLLECLPVFVFGVLPAAVAMRFRVGSR